MSEQGVAQGLIFVCVFTGIGLFISLIATGISSDSYGEKTAMKVFIVLDVILALMFLLSGFLAFALAK